MSSESGTSADLERFVTESRIREFLYREAELLDDRRLYDWLELFADDLTYRAPRRIMKESLNDAYSEESYYFDEDLGSLRMRVKRYDSEYAWAERPPTRSRRIVGNIRVIEDDDPQITVKNNIMLYLDREERTDYTFISARRRDSLRTVGDSFEIVQREIYLDKDIWPSAKISVFL